MRGAIYSCSQLDALSTPVFEHQGVRPRLCCQVPRGGVVRRKGCSGNQEGRVCAVAMGNRLPLKVKQLFDGGQKAVTGFRGRVEAEISSDDRVAVVDACSTSFRT